MNRKVARVFSVVAGGALIAGVAAGAGAGAYAAFAGDGTQTIVRHVTVPAAVQAAVRSTQSVGDVYLGAREGVVTISVASGGSATRTPLPSGEGQQRSQGSGFVYDAEGHIVTNQHVVDGAGTVSVRFWNGEIYKATVVGSDPSTDLAVIDVDAPASLLSPLALGDSTDLAVGDGVVAIGSPLGYEETVTSGIVSALDRQMEAPNGFTINNSIQTDAAINHGNSGGPLLTLDGKVVGVNAQIASDSGGNDGIGFAIPSSTIATIVADLLGDGTVEHAYLGVSVSPIPSSVAGELGASAGVAVAEVREDSPAAEAGLKAATGSRSVNGMDYPTGGDVITAVDGKAVATAEELQIAIDGRQPGDTISITYVRDGETGTAKVELAKRPT